MTMKPGKKIGEGRTSEVFELIDGRAGGETTGKIIKLFYNSVPESAIQLDYESSRKASSLKLPCPVAYEQVSIGGRRGFVLEHVPGEPLTAVIFHGTVATEKAAGKFAELQWQINSVLGPTFRPWKQALSEATSKIPGDILNPDELAAITTYIENLPDGNAACHLDFHPDNVLYADGDYVAIDWSFSARGPAALDFAVSSLILELGEFPPGWPPETISVLLQVRALFVARYRASYASLSGITAGEAARWYLPALAYRLGNWGLHSELDTLVSRIRDELARLGANPA